MRIKKILAAAALLLAGLCTAAEAAPITYELSSQFDGSLGGTNVTGAPFVWTITGDTSAAFSLGQGIVGVPAITSQIDFGGGLIATATNPTAALFRPSVALALFGNPFAAEGILFASPVLGAYNGLTAFGPTTVGFLAFLPIATDHGDWVITDISLGSFMATGGNVPEPVTLALFGAGLAGIGTMRRRKQKI